MRSKALKLLPTEKLVRRSKELNRSVDRLVKDDHVQAHEARMKLHRQHLKSSALVIATLLLYAGLGAFAALQIDNSPLEEFKRKDAESAEVREEFPLRCFANSAPLR